MTYRGHVKDGVVVPNGDVHLPEGAEVAIEILGELPDPALLDENGQTLGEKMLKYAGLVKGPSDLARNHDHYAHGKPPS